MSSPDTGAATGGRAGGHRGDRAGRVPRRDGRLVPAAVTVWAGALAGLVWTWWITVLCGLAGAVAGVLAGVFASRVPGPAARSPEGRRGLPAAAGVLCAAGIATALPMGLVLRDAEQDPLRAEAARGTSVPVHATVAERPRPVRSAGYGHRPGGVGSVLVPVDLVGTGDTGGTTPRGGADTGATGTEADADRPHSTGRVLLIAEPEGWADVLPGQRVSTRAELAPARGPGLTVAVGFVSEPPRGITSAPWWQRAAESVRGDLRAAAGVLGDEPAGLLPGLIVGDTGALPPRVEEEFLDAGLSHLMAVSGSNVTIVCGAVLLLVRSVGAGPRLAAATAGVALVAFVLLVGYEPSALRAGVMGGIGLLALALGRRGSALPALAAAVCLLVLADPAMAVNLGFALSVVATAGLVLLAPRWSDALGGRGLPGFLARGLAVPVVAFVVTAPVLAGTVGEVSVVSVVANMLAAPVVAPVTVLGAGAAVLAPVWAPSAELVVWLTHPGLTWLLLVARHAAAVPGAVVSWPSGWWGGLSAAVLLGAVVWLVRHRRGRVLLAVVVLVAVAVSVPRRVLAPGWPPRDWVFAACDVGQGDALVLATGRPGRAVVVDVGAEPAALDRCLDGLGVDRVPLVVLSHLHADHVAGLPAVFEGRQVGAVAVGPGREPGWAWRRVVRETGERHVRLVTVGAADTLTWSGLRLDVLGPHWIPAAQRGAGTEPGAAEAGADGTAVNNTSLVVRATTRAGRILLTGDVEPTAQADLLAAGADLGADVLKVPHHGSPAVLDRFLTAVRPRIAVVSVGDNSYGHPHPATLRTLRRAGTLVARTDTSGTVAVVADDGDPALVRRGRR